MVSYLAKGSEIATIDAPQHYCSTITDDNTRKESHFTKMSSESTEILGNADYTSALKSLDEPVILNKSEQNTSEGIMHSLDLVNHRPATVHILA